MKIVLASDHGGFALKEELKTYFGQRGIIVKDLGPDTDDTCSYAEQGLKLGRDVAESNGSELGIGICGTGLGMSFAVNRVKGIRGARLTSIEDATLAKKHNNANILVFGGRQITADQAIAMIEEFMKTEYEGGRHQERIDQLDK